MTQKYRLLDLKNKLELKDDTWEFIRYLVANENSRLTEIKLLYDKSVSPRDFIIPFQMYVSNDSSRLKWWVDKENGDDFEVDLVNGVNWEKVMAFFSLWWEHSPTPPTIQYECFLITPKTSLFTRSPFYKHVIYLPQNLREMRSDLTPNSTSVFSYGIPFEGEFTSVDFWVKHAMDFEDLLPDQVKNGFAGHTFSIYFGNRTYHTGLYRSYWKHEQTHRETRLIVSV